MCQLAAYIGDRQIAPLLLKALQYQEGYYGAHATGLAVIRGSKIELVKAPGHVTHVQNITNIEKLTGTTGLAHSRYNVYAKDDARFNTIGMAHPFIDGSEKLALMHNGNIANYREYWKRLKKTHVFSSYSEELDAITDSEVAIHMLSDEVAKGRSVDDTLKRMSIQYSGSFLFSVISVDEPDTIYIANWHQPCYIGIGDDEVMFCSSHRGFTDIKCDVDQIFEPPKNSFIKLLRGKVEISTLDPARRIPNLTLNMNKLGEFMIELLRKYERIDFREMFYKLGPESWAEAYGINPNEWEAIMRKGVAIVNPYIEVVDMLISEGRIIESIDPRVEGGIEGTPRYSYELA
jgi:glutamine phosphoribosylpyrophosphate amidotransferase